MIDQVQQPSFEGRYGNNVVTLKLTPATEHLHIEVQNSDTKEKHIQLIGSESIAQRENFKCFPNPKAIYDFLSSNFNAAVVDDASIRFVYPWETEAGRMEKPIVIDLVKEEADQLELTLRKVDRFGQKVAEERFEKIQRQYEEKERKQREQFEEQARSKLEGKIKSMKKGAMEAKQLAKVYHHEGNTAHAKYYSLTNSGPNTVKILRQGEDRKSFNFVNGAQILPLQKMRYRITICKSAKGCILAGFCSNQGLGNLNNYTHPESGYYYYWGFSYEGGSSSSGLPVSKLGDVVECEADRSVGVLRWFKNGSLLKESKVPQSIQGKPAYFSIVMFNAGDEIEVSV